MAENHDIKAIAELACLQMDEKDLASYERHFTKILQYFETLKSVETSTVSPMITPHGTQVPLRADQVQKDLQVEEVLENAPDVKDSLFKVPPVV